MKISSLVVLSATSTTAFQCRCLPSTRFSSIIQFGYIPDGFTKESYAKFKAEEAKKKQKKNLGIMGPKGFQSRSFQSFQQVRLFRRDNSHTLQLQSLLKLFAY
jgi:hypothetical protein